MTNLEKVLEEIKIAVGLNVLGKDRVEKILTDHFEELEKLTAFTAFVKDIRDNYDCDSDAHKYGTWCRCCQAAALIGEK